MFIRKNLENISVLFLPWCTGMVGEHVYGPEKIWTWGNCLKI